ncbi:MAG: response regulator [Chloroflexi bacterium]|nr:response regulator [Ktedonobacteraceae bacterium]MBV9021764.1 response regulator [Ktedonobacteraceae bacterium]MBV9709249.1 response regulator [Chloroflexota bacterium]
MSKRILVIEPSPTLRAILQMYFQRDGHQTVLFEDYEAATQALPRFQAEHPDLVFIAVQADRPESLHLVTLLRQQDAKMPLIIMVPQDDSSQPAIQRLIQTTAAIPLLKPFSIRDVLNLVADPGQASTGLPNGQTGEKNEHT